MKLVKIDNDTIINVEKVLGLTAASPNTTYVHVEGDKRFHVQYDIYRVRKILEDAIKEM